MSVFFETPPDGYCNRCKKTTSHYWKPCKVGFMEWGARLTCEECKDLVIFTVNRLATESDIDEAKDILKNKDY